MNKFEDMKAFIRIVDAGSITKAAEQLNIAKSALSKKLSTIENKLGLTLINRTTRTLAITDNGKAYYQQCLRIIDDVMEMESVLQNKQCHISGNIKIAIPLSYGLSHIQPALIEFNKKYREIILEIDLNDRKTNIINEGYDLAIRVGELEDSGLMAKKLTTERTLLVASESYLKNHGNPVIPDDLYNGHIKLQYKNAATALSFKNQNGDTVSINIKNAMVSNNGDFLCQSAVAGLGIISTPSFICSTYIKNKQLVPILKDYFLPSIFPVHAIYPQTRHLSRKVRMLIDFLAHYFKS